MQLKQTIALLIYDFIYCFIFIVVDTSTIRLIEEGCDNALLRLIEKNGANPTQCFCVHLKNGGGTITVICPLKEDRDGWVAGLLYLFGKRQGDLQAA